MQDHSHIVQINISDGGVPKLPIRSATIGREGVAGDRQADLRHHGGPDRAVSLYALERILALQAEGHPIYPGSTGENITTVGLDLDICTPGTVIRLGNEVVLEVTGYAAPCRNISRSFAEETFTRISQKIHPGWSRLYCRVLHEGAVAIGDQVALQPIASEHDEQPDRL